MAFEFGTWTLVPGILGLLALAVGFMGGRAVKKKDAVKVAGIFLLGFAVLVGTGLVPIGSGSMSIGGGGSGAVIADVVSPNLLGCPTDGDSSLKIDVVNTANESGSEGFDVTGYLYQKNSDGSLTYFASITDTTSPSAATIDCGKDYVFKIVSASGAGGDNTVVKQIKSGKGTINSEGNLEFTAASSNPSFILGVDQNAAISVRAIDNNDAGNYLCNSDDLCTDYETDGVTYVSTTNGTVLDETVGLDLTFQLKATDTADNANDRGILVLLEMPTTAWSTSPIVYANGERLSEMKGALTTYEARAYSGYEYAFLIPQSMVLKDGSEGIALRVVNNLAPGIATASADPEIDLAPRGAYLGIDSINVGYGAVKDDSSNTQVNTLFDITLDVTE